MPDAARQIQRLVSAERFNPGDNATHKAADHSADGIPTAHVQPTESATRHTQQDVAYGMLAPDSSCVGQSLAMREHRTGTTDPSQSFTETCFFMLC
jgi:hypothetical protein